MRREREDQGIGLRQFARQIGVSPTYLSKIERDEFGPPAEDKVNKIADLLDLDRDELLALAGKVATDLKDIIRQKPQQMASFLRTASGLSGAELETLAQEVKRRRKQ